MDITEAQRFKTNTILIAGDLMLDKYIGGMVKRISPEAPVPVLNTTWERSRLGGAGNVVNNIQALSATSRVLSCIGTDENGNIIQQLLESAGADTSFLMRDDDVFTITKTRIVAKNQQVVRVDKEKTNAIPKHFFDEAETHFGEIFEGVHALVLSDYGKGILSSSFTQALIREARKRKIPVLVDPKGADWRKYTGATICTPNLSELSEACGKELSQEMEEDIRANALELCRKLDMQYILVTRSEKGMSLVHRDGIKTDFPAKKKEVIDVSGAGDTVISTMALGMASEINISECCHLANSAAGVVVSKFGTATVSLNELIGAELFAVGKKRIEQDEIRYLASYLHDQGKRIVFTNGCFDLVHAGHVFSLEQAKAFGDVLIVGINSDASVRRLKGEKRPIVNENDRAYLLQSLSVVDYVFVFDDDTPEKLIRMIEPDVLAKGKDYEGKIVVGSDVVESRGGSVQLIDLKPGLSTTSIIQKIKSAYHDEM